jgi:hypothetical protein
MDTERGRLLPPSSAALASLAVSDMTTKHTAIFVFKNGRPDLIGLSVECDGANLPIVNENDEPWRVSKITPFTWAGLAGVTVDIEVALANLRTRGYHIGRTEAVILEFPFGGRASAER